MKKKNLLAINLLVVISLSLGLSGFVGSTAVLAVNDQSATSTPALPDGVFAIPLQPGADFQPPASDQNLVASGVGEPPSIAAAAGVEGLQ